MKLETIKKNKKIDTSMHTPEGRVQLLINQKYFLDECVEKQL